MTDNVEWPTNPVSEETLVLLFFLLFSNIVRTCVKVVTMIVFVNQMLLMMAGDVERNPGPGKYNKYFFVYVHCMKCIVSQKPQMN